MSDLLGTTPPCATQDHPCSGIKTIVAPQQRDLGGFTVRRLLPSAGLRAVGPFVFFDHLGPAFFASGTGIDVKPHPHIGLATVTYLFAGELLHRDSLGCVQAIRPGAINLMTAGRGIVHSERTPPEVRHAPHAIHALQLWLALPAEEEETEPAFYHYAAEQIPHLQLGGASVRVLIGSALGLTSPVKTYAPTLYLEVDLEPGGAFRLPATAGERAVYVVAGSLQVQGTTIAQHSLALFETTAAVDLQATAATRLVVLGGQPLGKRTVWWNLVATRRELIEKAKADWQAGRFPAIPGESGVTPLPE